LGFSQGLGVTCTHCHDPQNFASDTLRPKRAAREMQAMLRGINDRLRTLQNTQHTVPAISCSTCHRGSAIPRPFEAR
ncbi:MAG TPA: photosynthetic reaction center cytochrome c subunit family protein, partial [Rhodothermales bacterium]|nr:photosynthetic reaction center cytochrome c subunit family protein [Rhodothermales bacterium]